MRAQIIGVLLLAIYYYYNPEHLLAINAADIFIGLLMHVMLSSLLAWIIKSLLGSGHQHDADEQETMFKNAYNAYVFINYLTPTKILLIFGEDAMSLIVYALFPRSIIAKVISAFIFGFIHYYAKSVTYDLQNCSIKIVSYFCMLNYQKYLVNWLIAHILIDGICLFLFTLMYRRYMVEIKSRKLKDEFRAYIRKRTSN